MIDFLTVVTKPNTQAHVFVRFLVSIPKLTIMNNVDIEINEDTISFMPYDSIVGLLEQGHAELV